MQKRERAAAIKTDEATATTEEAELSKGGKEEDAIGSEAVGHEIKAKPKKINKRSSSSSSSSSPPPPPL